MARFIFVTGGVVSSLGKGLSSASLGYLLKSQGYKVRIRKMDPYLNVDPGTMSPFQHGEVFVTDDGAETDLDLGHYERFTNISAKKSDNITTGKIYSDIISKERKGDYLGKTVQVIPHVTERIKQFIKKDIKNEDFVICEIGGTVGDIESLPFLEAIRQFSNDIGKEKTLFVHLTLVPFLKSSDEIKTKPTQHSVKELRSIGIQPDIIICRSQQSIPLDQRKKISLFCNIPIERVIETVDVKTIYDVPILMYEEGLDKVVMKRLEIYLDTKPDLKQWQSFLKRHKHPKSSVTIGLIGKYVELQDSYKSILESFVHAGAVNEVEVKVVPVHSSDLDEKDVHMKFESFDGVLVAPGFGERGIEGKINAIKYVREQKIPFFGICLGMQMAVIEYARNVLELSSANSVEMDADTPHPVISLMDEQRNIANKGGTMRLGAWACAIGKNTLLHKIYNSDNIKERHRHRYEFNDSYYRQFNKHGMIASGVNPETKLVEAIELLSHPWFLGVQYHPEYRSTVAKPHPLFVDFVKACNNYAQSKK